METIELLKSLGIKSVDGKAVNLEPLAKGIDLTLENFSRYSGLVKANREDIRDGIILKFCEKPISIDTRSGNGYALGRMYAENMCKATVKKLSGEELVLDRTANSDDIDTDEDNNFAAACHSRSISRSVMEWQSEESRQARIEKVRACMNSFKNEVDRKIVEMEYVDGFQREDIADRLNMSVSNVNKRFSTVIKPALKAKLA